MDKLVRNFFAFSKWFSKWSRNCYDSR